MNKRIDWSAGHAILVSLTTVSVVCLAPTMVLAQDDDDVPPPSSATHQNSSKPKSAGASNIFTTPSDKGDDEAPSFNGAGRQAHRHDDIPNFNQIRNIPSLSKDQRLQIRNIFGELKEQGGNAQQKLQALKEKAHGDFSQADPETRQEAMQLRKQVQQLRMDTWQKVKPLLSDSQLQELESMRHGELPASTFNQGRIGPGGGGGGQGGGFGPGGGGGGFGQGNGQGRGNGQMLRRMQQWRQNQNGSDQNGSGGGGNGNGSSNGGDNAMPGGNTNNGNSD